MDLRVGSWSEIFGFTEPVRDARRTAFGGGGLDQEQGYILRELIRYFEHGSAGVSYDMQMCSEWPTVVERRRHCCVERGAMLAPQTSKRVHQSNTPVQISGHTPIKQ